MSRSSLDDNSQVKTPNSFSAGYQTRLDIAIDSLKRIIAGEDTADRVLMVISRTMEHEQNNNGPLSSCENQLGGKSHE